MGLCGVEVFKSFFMDNDTKRTNLLQQIAEFYEKATKDVAILPHKNQEYDTFPINLLEQNGYIKRHSFIFNSTKMVIYMLGTETTFQVNNFIEANILSNGSMQVRFSFKPFQDIANVNYPEISENEDRILWSKNLCTGGAGTEEGVPPFMSLYYQHGKLKRVAFTFKNAKPEMLVEYY